MAHIQEPRGNQNLAPDGELFYLCVQNPIALGRPKPENPKHLYRGSRRAFTHTSASNRLSQLYGLGFEVYWVAVKELKLSYHNGYT